MGAIVTTRPKSERKPAMLWTPWGSMPKDGKSRLQVKSRWLSNAAGPAGGARSGQPVHRRRES